MARLKGEIVTPVETGDMAIQKDEAKMSEMVTPRRCTRWRPKSNNQRKGHFQYNTEKINQQATLEGKTNSKVFLQWLVQISQSSQSLEKSPKIFRAI